MIYIEFCIRKSILIFLGVSHFWGTGPPKSQLLAAPTPNAYKVLSPSEEFSKKPTYVCSSASELQSQHKTWLLMSIAAVPLPENRKKTAVLPVLVPFSAIWLEHHSYQYEVSFRPSSIKPRHRTEIIREGFAFFAYRSRYRGFSRGFWEQSQKTASF